MFLQHPRLLFSQHEVLHVIYEYSYSFSSMSSRLVSIFAPYLTLYLPDLTFDQLPFIVFGLGTLLGSIGTISILSLIIYYYPNLIL